jgi:arginyl-tRNA synthetase
MNYNFKKIPKNLNKPKGLCYYGILDQETKNLLIKNNFTIKEFDNYTDIYFTKKSNIQIFDNNIQFKYLDGFSPNLNKELHIGHFSNLVIAKAFQKLNIAYKTIAMFGDTLKGELDNWAGLLIINTLLKKFNYKINKRFFASKLKYKGKLLDGTKDYINTKIINIDNNPIVMIKSNGSTSYTYHDLSLAQYLNKSTLYLTGYEQEEHFNILKKVYSTITHIPLGLVKISNSKMSSRGNNVILITDLLLELTNIFNGKILNNDCKLYYNVFAGYILKTNPKSDKNINITTINNPKTSLGLYLSYTMARLYKAGCFKIPILKLDKELEYSLIQSKNNLNPSILFSELIEYCKELNQLYETKKIKGNLKNRVELSIKLSNLIYYSNKIGLFFIKKV